MKVFFEESMITSENSVVELLCEYEYQKKKFNVAIDPQHALL